MKKSIALLLAGLVVAQPVFAGDTIVCPPETHTAMSAATLAIPMSDGKNMYGVNVADYLSGQLCFGLNVGAATQVATSLSCRAMEALPQHTKDVLRKRDCPAYVPPMTPAPVATMPAAPGSVPNMVLPANR